jgi:small subunit ribosomal protein S2
MVAAAAALAGVAMKRRARVVQVATQASRNGVPRKLQLNKGSKPLHHRYIFRDYLKEMHKPLVKRFNKEGGLKEFENWTKKMAYGQVKWSFTSRHFNSEDLNLVDSALGGDSGGQRKEPVDHHVGDPYYVRKYLEPAKFKKLELAAWEMPATYSQSVTLKELVDAGVQYGHTTSVWHQDMLKFLYADHDGTHIFDLVQTAAWLNRACYYCMEAASKGAKFIFVGTKEQAQESIKEAGLRTNSYYANKRFVGGMLTNFGCRQESLELMASMERQKAQGVWDLDGEAVRAEKEKKLAQMQEYYKGMEGMDNYPDIMIVVDEKKERYAVAEASTIGIPVICLADSNSNPKHLDLPIPGNASGKASIDLVLGKLAEAIQRGQALMKATPPAERFVHYKAWDPWLWCLDRDRIYRRRSKRQPWHKQVYGSYEAYVRAHPYGKIRPVVPYKKWSWTVFRGLT